MRRLIAAAALLACASPGLPPGGPQDRAAPELIAVSPDTGATAVRPRAVVFRFDEVVSERPQGVATLDRLFVISPRDREPHVDWKRSAVTVRPREGWRPNTTYTVTMLPGLSDLRGNARSEGAAVTFSTGPSIPDTRIAGVVYDWPAGLPARRAWVEAIQLPDSTTYVAVSDSSGQFVLSHLAPGTYILRGILDANANRALDPREAWDTAVVTLADTADVELLAFVHDTIGPGIRSVLVRDSLTLRITFDRPLAPDQPIGAGVFTLRTEDSVDVALSGAWTAREFERERARLDSIRADSVAAAVGADTLARRRETPRAVPAKPLPGGAVASEGAAAADTVPAPRQPSRPAPGSDVILKVAEPLRPGAYRLQARNVRNLLGVPRSSERVVTVPRPASRTAPADSVRTPAPASPRAPRAGPGGDGR